jgi:hypothetical protein
MSHTETDPFRRVPSPKDRITKAFQGYRTANSLSIHNCRAPDVRTRAKKPSSGRRFSNRPDFETLDTVVSGFFAADDEVDRGNEDHADQDVHGKRHGSVPPSQAIYGKSIARRREAIKTHVNDAIPPCKIGLILTSISSNNIKVTDLSGYDSRRPE